VVLRGRNRFVSWEVALDNGEAGFIEQDGTPAVQRSSSAELDVRTAALGGALEDDVWDVRYSADWLGMMRLGAVRTDTMALPAIIDGRTFIVYRNTQGGLSIDTTQRLRNLITDAVPRLGPIGRPDRIRISLENLHLNGEALLTDTRLAITSEAGVREGDALDLDDAAVVPLRAELRADSSRAIVLGSVEVSANPGDRYLLLANREDKWRTTKYRVMAGEHGELELRLIEAGTR